MSARAVPAAAPAPTGMPLLDAEAIERQARRAQRRERLRVAFWQLLILASVLGIWEGLTRIPWFKKNTIFDPFFISQPSQVAVKLWDWTFGAQAGFIWPHLGATLWATFLGLVVGVGTGFLAGLLLSQNRVLNRVLHPFIVATNSMPRIAFVPLITMVFGLGVLSKVVTAWFVVFFLVFFNAFKGAVSIDREMVDFCRTLGASPRQVTRSVRIPMALAWTFASLPNAVSFALIGVVIAEFVGSNFGMGHLIIVSLAMLNAAEMFAALVLLSLIGLALVMLLRIVERRLLRWSNEFRDDA
ncbi:MAG: ABC transporter permease [Sneathiellaceae bacterium]